MVTCSRALRIGKKDKAQGKRVIAVGTTSCVHLKCQSKRSNKTPWVIQTFYSSGYAFQCIDGLFTNLHLPR